jgi:threonine/homoserine/homoserine lactone efflux protein
MINDILAGLPWGLFLSFMVGPVFFILLETSITKGFRAAIVFDFGVVLGDIFFIAVAYLGSYRLIQSLKDKPALFIFGGIIMLAYGLISFVRLRNEEKIDDEEIDRDIIKRNYGSLFVKGFLLNVINIGVLRILAGCNHFGRTKIRNAKLQNDYFFCIRYYNVFIGRLS